MLRQHKTRDLFVLSSTVEGLLNAITPGALIWHRDDVTSRGLAVSVTGSITHVMWSVSPGVTSEEVDVKFNRLKEYTPEEATILHKKGQIKAYAYELQPGDSVKVTVEHWPEKEEHQVYDGSSFGKIRYTTNYRR